MIFDILTLFPGIFATAFAESMLNKACAREIIDIHVHNIRSYATDRQQMADDRPFGGGDGMIMKPEPIVAAIEDLTKAGPKPHVILLTPQGRLFDQSVARELSCLDRLILICGRYEGVDERVASYYVDDCVSIGDFILTGGEFAAMVVVDAVARLIPGVLGNASSADIESFSEPLLEYPQYTRPQDFRGHSVPEILLSGNHAEIKRWRSGQALLRTRKRRPDLFARLQLSSEDEKSLEQAEDINRLKTDD